MSNQCLSCFANNLENAQTCQSCGSLLIGTTEQSTHASPLCLAPGTLLCQRRYKIEKVLGQGGFGIAYKGFDLMTSQAIAIKEYWPENAGRQGNGVIWPSTQQQRQKEIQDVKNEFSRLKRCIHPNIVKAYDDFEENNTVYFVMDFHEGQSLLEILEHEGRLLENRVLKYFLQIAAALKIIHGNQILHRDIKPENIIIDRMDNPILIDFGSAREFIADKTQRHTRLVTPGYAPFEQYLSAARPSSATDIYAVCASMYELLTGELPTPSLERKSQDNLKPPRQIVPNLSLAIEQTILMGMRMEVKDRLQTADELIDALNGKFVSPVLRLSRQLAEQHKLAQAVVAYEKCLVNEPNNGEAAVELALIQIYINDHQAELAAQKAIQLKPNDGRSYGVLGLVKCRQANWSEAAQYLQRAANLSPGESWIQANLAWALAKSDKWQAAEMAVNQAIQLDSNSTFALGIQAWIAVNQQQWKPAIRAARLAITKSKHQVKNSQELQRWVYPCLTIALEKAVVTKGNDVERCLQEFITQVPDSAFAWGFKGWKQTNLGLLSEAISSFEQAKQQRHAPAWVFLNLGITQELQQNIPAAIQAYEACHQNFPSDAFIQFRLGNLLGKQKQWQQARLCLEKAIDLQPDYAEAYHNLAWVLVNMRGQDGKTRFREILSAYHKAAELYAQQQKHSFAQNIKQAILNIGIKL